MVEIDNDHANSARVVADVGVLTADLLVGGPARESLDHLRRHSWLDLVATGRLLDDAQAVVGRLADDDLAREWRQKVDELAVVVEQPPGDHPALAAAYRGEAAHLITLDERLTSAEAGANLRGVMDVSIRSPEAFVAVFDPQAVYELLFDDSYPGPDRNPRAD